MYGLEYDDAYSVLVIILVENILLILFKVIITLFLAIGKTKLNFILLLIPIVIGLFPYYTFIPFYGIIGFAFSACISLFISGILFLKFFTKLESVKIVDLFSIKREDRYFTFFLRASVKSIKSMLDEILIKKKKNRKDKDEKQYY